MTVSGSKIKMFWAPAGLQTKKSGKEPLAPIRKKLRSQIIFLGATE